MRRFSGLRTYDCRVLGCSSFKSADEFFSASGFKAQSREDFAAIPDDEWDTFVDRNTSYGNWQDMLRAAGLVWTKGQLGL